MTDKPQTASSHNSSLTGKVETEIDSSRRDQTEKEVLYLLDSIKLSQTGWEGSEDVMTFNGQPIGATVSNRGLEIDRWWPELKTTLAKQIAHHLDGIDIANRTSLESSLSQVKEIVNSECNGESLMYNGDGPGVSQIKNCCENIRLRILHRLATEDAKPSPEREGR